MSVADVVKVKWSSGCKDGGIIVFGKGKEMKFWLCFAGGFFYKHKGIKDT
jgi:hypothetical protein